MSSCAPTLFRNSVPPRLNLLHHFHLLPLPARDRLIDRFQDGDASRAGEEAGASVGVVGDGLQHVVDGVDEGVVVAEHVAGGPPRAGVGVAAFGGDDPPEAARIASVFGRVIVEVVQILEAPDERTFAAVDFDAIKVLPAGSEPGCFEAADCAARVLGEE